MACPSCSHTMTPLGCKVTDKTFFWCPRCGTIKPCEEAEAVAPALVERCREFEADHYMHPTTHLGDLWRRLGIAESIHPPEERPAPEHTEETLKGGTE